MVISFWISHHDNSILPPPSVLGICIPPKTSPQCPVYFTWQMEISLTYPQCLAYFIQQLEVGLSSHFWRGWYISALTVSKLLSIGRIPTYHISISFGDLNTVTWSMHDNYIYAMHMNHNSTALTLKVTPSTSPSNNINHFSHATCAPIHGRRCNKCPNFLSWVAPKNVLLRGDVRVYL